MLECSTRILPWDGIHAGIMSMAGWAVRKGLHSHALPSPVSRIDNALPNAENSARRSATLILDYAVYIMNREVHPCLSAIRHSRVPIGRVEIVFERDITSGNNLRAGSEVDDPV